MANFKKIQEKMQKTILKHTDENIMARNKIMYYECPEYTFMTALNCQAWVIPKNAVNNEMLNSYGEQNVDAMVKTFTTVLDNAKYPLKYLGVYKEGKIQFVLFEGENDEGNFIIAFNKKVLTGVKYDNVWGYSPKCPALFYEGDVPVLLQAPCVLSDDVLKDIKEELSCLAKVKHFQFKI